MTVADIRGAGLCTRGARLFFEARGLDWTDFITHGAPIEQARALGDVYVDRAIKAAEARQRGQ